MVGTDGAVETEEADTDSLSPSCWRLSSSSLSSSHRLSQAEELEKRNMSLRYARRHSLRGDRINQKGGKNGVERACLAKPICSGMVSLVRPRG